MWDFFSYGIIRVSVCQKIKLQSPSIIVGVKNNRRIYIGDITSRFVKIF